MIRNLILFFACLVSVPAVAADSPVSAADLAPTGTLRAVYIGTNPVQAFVDAASGETRGPAAVLAAGLAQRAGVPLEITGVAGVQGVLDAVLGGAADIGFLAYDAGRAEQVEFTQAYAIGYNSYIVREDSPLRLVADADRAGVRIGVNEGDAGDGYLTRTLQAATLVRSRGNVSAEVVNALLDGSLDAFAGNRMRLYAAVQETPGLRLLEDNFYGVEQAVIVPRGNVIRRALVDAFIDEARAAGLIAEGIAAAGLVGVEVAPAVE